MKSPTAESSFKLLEAVRVLLQCEELQSDDVAEPTHQLGGDFKATPCETGFLELFFENFRRVR